MINFVLVYHIFIFMSDKLKNTWTENKINKESKPFNLEQQKRFQKEREEVFMLLKSQRKVLSNEAIISYVEKFHHIDLSKYSPEISKKFVEEIQKIFKEFNDFDESMITKLRSIREWMSFWMESWKSNEYYRNMIIWNALQTRIIYLKWAIDSITWDKIKVGNKEYNKADYENFKNKTTNLDEKKWINIFSKINLEETQKFKEIFAREIKKQVDKSNPKYNLIISDLIRLPQVVWEKWFENLTQVKLKNWETLNLEELFLEYNKNYKDFKNKNRVFEFWNKQLKSWMTNWFWFQEGKYNLWYDELKETYAKDLDIEKMSLADLVIMLRVLFWIVPVAWDALWWYDDGKQALAKMNFDWSMQWLGENIFMYLVSLLELSIVWWWFAKLAKWPKLTKTMITLWKIIEKFSKTPEMLSELAKNEKVIQMLESMKWVVPKVSELLDKISSTKTLKLSDKMISQKTDAELLSYLQKSKIEKIDISELSKSQKTRLNHILTQNFPLVEIFRLVSWDYLHTINISWIKQINDIAWQAFCDKVLDTFKKVLKSNIETTQSTLHKTRTVKDDYKTLAFVSDKEDVSQNIFWWKNKTQIIEYIIKMLENDIVLDIRKTLEEQLKGKKISLKSSETIEDLADKKVLEVKQTIITHFDFWFSSQKVAENANQLEKLDAMRKWEISAKVWEKTTSIIPEIYDESKNISRLREVFSLEKEIIQEFYGKKFQFRWTYYEIVFNKSGELSLSTELLKYVRKYPSEITPKELVEKIKWYFLLLNNSLDYITPIRWKIDAKSKWIEKARKINKQFQSWIIKTTDLFQNFKWWLSKTAFLEAIKWKNWYLFSIDIKDMWIDNILDFKKLAKKIIKLDDDFISWKISKEFCESQKMVYYLEAWKTVTDRFDAFQKTVKQKYPTSFFRIGWDEIEIFMPKVIWNIEQNSQNISKLLQDLHLKSRLVAHNFDWKNVSHKTEQLEKLTKVSKIVEEEIQSQFTKNWNISNIPNNTNVFIDWIWDILFKEWFDLDRFLAQIKRIIPKNWLSYIKTDITFEILDWIKMTIKKSPNFQLEIYLHN